MSRHAWEDLLAFYLRCGKEMGEKLPPPADDADIAFMLKRVRLYGLTVDPTMVDFYRISNGTSFDGLRIYGAHISEGDVFHRLDLVEANKYIFSRGSDTVLGSNDLEYFVCSVEGETHKRVDQISWDTIEEYTSCDDLLSAVIEAENSYLREQVGLQ